MIDMEELERRHNAFLNKQASDAGISVAELFERNLREEERKTEESNRASMLRQLEGIGIPARAWKAVNDVPDTTEALTAVSSRKDIIVLSGEPGRGKTVAAAAWILLDYGKWISAGALARGYAYDQEAFNSLACASRLVIDDLGTEYQDQKDRYQATLAELLECRFANERPTLITTNLGPAEFKERYGERIASRIREDGVFALCTGDDLRRVAT